MSGTRAPIMDILDLCEEFGAISVIDEVHAVGLYGTEGGGILDALGMRGRADIVTGILSLRVLLFDTSLVIGTLGKAFGVSGGFVAGKAHWIDVIRSTAPSFIFTTSMPPHVAAGSLASVVQVQKYDHLRQLLHRQAAYVKEHMLAVGLPLMSSETHILPLKVGDGELCKALADQLLEHGIYVQPINFPSVPRGEELLRFTTSPKHTQAHCDHLVDTLAELFGKHGLLVSEDKSGEERCICGQSNTCDFRKCPVLRTERVEDAQQAV